MITDAILDVMFGLLAWLSGQLPAVPSWLVAPDYAGMGATFGDFVSPAGNWVPLPTALGVIYSLMLLRAVIMALRVVTWVYEHIPAIGAGG